MSNNNNPFENGNNSSPFETGNTTKIHKTQMKKSKKNNQNYKNSFNSKQKRKPAVILVILVILVIILAANWWKVQILFDNLGTKIELNNIKIVEDYTFDSKDITDESYQPLLDLKIGQGKDYSVDETNENFFANSDGGLEGTFVVGRDIEPGIYTMTVSGDGYLNTDTTLSAYFDIPREGENVYYNVPLVNGDKIEIKTYNSDKKVSLDLKKQSEYVEYVPDEGMLGVYIYGLSNFNPEVTLNKNDYSSIIYGYPDTEYSGYINKEYIFDQNITLNGGESTYIIIQ